MLQPLQTQELNFRPFEDRQSPQNLDAEEAVLGGILLDPNAIERVSGLLMPAWFALPANQTIYTAMMALHAQRLPTDLLNVVTWLRDRNRLEQAGGETHLYTLLEQTVSSVNIDQYGLLLADKAVRRRLIQAGGEIENLAYETHKLIDDVVDEAEQKLTNVTQVRQLRGLESIVTLVNEAVCTLEERFQGLTTAGLTCGLSDLDALTQGFQRSDLIIVAGRPSMGKTTFTIEIARNVAKLHKLPIAIFSLEMSKEQLMYRMLASSASVDSMRLRTGSLSTAEWERCGNAASEIASLPIFIDDSPGMTALSIRSKARRLQAEHGPLGLVIVDYLQLLDLTRYDESSRLQARYGNREQIISAITRSLKHLARELNVPVIALSQLSRNVESRSDKRPLMSDLRESGAIEQEANLVLMLYRDEIYDPNSSSKGIMEVNIVKNREGPTGSVEVLFERQFNRIRSVRA